MSLLQSLFGNAVAAMNRANAAMTVADDAKTDAGSAQASVTTLQDTVTSLLATVAALQSVIAGLKVAVVDVPTGILGRKTLAIPWQTAYADNNYGVVVSFQSDAGALSSTYASDLKVYAVMPGYVMVSYNVVLALPVNILKVHAIGLHK